MRSRLAIINKNRVQKRFMQTGIDGKNSAFKT